MLLNEIRIFTLSSGSSAERKGECNSMLKSDDSKFTGRKTRHRDLMKRLYLKDFPIELDTSKVYIMYIYKNEHGRNISRKAIIETSRTEIMKRHLASKVK